MSLSRSLWLRALAIAGLCLLAAAPNFAADALRWKFKQGEAFPYALAQKANILIDANGIEIDVALKQIMDTTWTVKSVAGDGTAEIAMKVDRVQLLMNTPFTGEVAYDSNKPDEKPPAELWDRLGKPLEAMVGGEFALKVSPRGQVTDLTLPESLKAALEEQAQGGGGGQMMMMGGSMLSENTIRQTIEQAVLLFPESASEKSWKRQFENKMGPIGTQKIDVTYESSGKEDYEGKSLEKIASKTEVTFEPNENADIDAEFEITEQEGVGAILFDSAAGKTTFSTNTQKITLEGDFQGNEFAQEITLNLVLKAGKSEDLPKDEEEKADEEKAEGESDEKEEKSEGDEKEEKEDK